MSLWLSSRVSLFFPTLCYERLTFASPLQFPLNSPAWKAFTGERNGGGEWGRFVQLKPNEKRVENTAVFETISNTDANFLNLHIDKATKTRGDKQVYLITHFTKQIFNLNYLLLMLNVTVQLLKNPKQKSPFFF